MKLIVGLGNPGEQYQKVRHNLGFAVLDEFARKCAIDNKRSLRPDGLGQWTFDKNLKSEIVKSQILNVKCIIAKPQTYMNNSGMAVRLLADYYKIAPTDMIIIHDELDLPLGKIKVRMGGAGAGHHGVESIIKALDTDKFIRVRLGIGNLKTQSSEHKKAHVSAEKFVLEVFLHSEKAQVKHMLKQALKAVELLLEQGLEKAQNQFN